MITGPKSFGWKLFWLVLFAAAMAYLESAVVVYLRLIYYPEGFEFPLKIISGSTIWIEVGREAATLIMLISIGILSASTGPGRFAAVCFIFGVWDIFYYIWLWIFIGWPQSLLTWDLLFLIPAPWIGPVITPVLVSICLIIAGIIVLKNESKGRRFRPPAWAWWIEIACGVIIIAAFLWNIPAVISQSIPQSFPWLLFAVGLLTGIIIFLTILSKSKNFEPIEPINKRGKP